MEEPGGPQSMRLHRFRHTRETKMSHYQPLLPLSPSSPSLCMEMGGERRESGKMPMRCDICVKELMLPWERSELYATALPQTQ